MIFYVIDSDNAPDINANNIGTRYPQTSGSEIANIVINKHSIKYTTFQELFITNLFKNKSGCLTGKTTKAFIDSLPKVKIKWKAGDSNPCPAYSLLSVYRHIILIVLKPNFIQYTKLCWVANLISISNSITI